MKKITIIIKAEKLEAVKQVLADNKVSGVMVSNIMGYGNQQGHTSLYRGTEYTVNFLPKIKVETVVSDDKVEALLTAIQQEVSTGNIGDGKIFVFNVEEAVRIRTGERGDAAI
jgi:nitrogen regulatory protein P-II 1